MKQRYGHSTQHRDRLLNLHTWNHTQDFYRCLGKKLGDALRNYDEYKNAKADLEFNCQHIREQINEGLGIDSKWPEWELSRLIRMIKEKDASGGISNAKSQ